MKRIIYTYLSLFLFQLSLFGQLQIGENIISDASKEHPWYLDISDDGRRFIALDPLHNLLSIFDWNGKDWEATAQIGCSMPDSCFLYNAALSGDGNVISIIETNRNIQVFEWKEDEWKKRGQPITAERSYSGIDLSYDGSHLVFQFNERFLKVLSWDGLSWLQLGTPIRLEFDITPLGDPELVISSDGSIIGTGIPIVRAGQSFQSKAIVYRLNGSFWEMQGLPIDGPEIATAAIRAYDDYFDMSDNGETIVLGHQAKILVHEWDDQNWKPKGQELTIISGVSSVHLDRSGSLLAFSEEGYSDKEKDLIFAGRLQVLKYHEGTWSNFGSSVLGDQTFDLFGTTACFSRNGLVGIGCGMGPPSQDVYLKAFSFDLSNVQYKPVTYLSSSSSECDYARKLDKMEYCVNVGKQTYRFILPDVAGWYLPVFDSALVTPKVLNINYNIEPYSSLLILDSIENHSNKGIAVDTFCLVPKDTGIHDVKVDIIIPDQPRPGRVLNVRLVYSNIGTSIRSGTVNLFFDGNVQSVHGSEPMYVGEDINTLTWTYQDLLPFEQRVIDVEFELNRPTDDPPLNGGEKISYSAKIEPTRDDADVTNNFVEAYAEVVNSFDPNDKRCMQGDTLSPESVGQRLTYIIRFENVGNAEAIDVRIQDVIDTTRLDISSFEFLESSHDPVIRIAEGNIIDFIFQDINLPFEDEFNDGYVAFSIKSKKNLLIGDEIVNRAGIYFDFNYPVVTNDAVTLIADRTTDVDKYQMEMQFNATPNPVSDIMQIQSKEPFIGIRIYSPNGSLAYKRTYLEGSTNDASLDLSDLLPGTYILYITARDRSGVLKFIKK